MIILHDGCPLSSVVGWFSHITYLCPLSDATKNFRQGGAALALKRLGVHGPRALLETFHSTSTAFTSLMPFLKPFLILVGVVGWWPRARGGKDSTTSGPEEIDTSQWLGTLARSATVANYTSRGGRRHRMVMVPILVFLFDLSFGGNGTAAGERD
jgi:hypothetical protein